MKCFGWTDFRAFVTENALCPIFSLTGFFVNFNIHGAKFQAFAAMDAFIFIFCIGIMALSGFIFVPPSKGHRLY